MEFQQLKAFAAVAQHKNITAAARELNTTQPAVSKQLKKLECSYNIKLLIRRGTGVELTPEGVEFLKYVEPILETVQTLERRFSTLRNANSTSPLRIGGVYAIATSVLPALVDTFKKQYQKLEVVLRSNSGSTLEQMLTKGFLDLLITTIAPNSADLTAEPCMRMKVVAVVGKGFHLPNQKVLMLRDVEHVPLIIRNDPEGRRMTETFLRKMRDEGIKPNILMQCDSPEAIKTAVRKKLGIGILYEDLVKEDLARGSFRRVRISDLPAEVQSYVVYDKQRPLSASAEVFLNILRKHACSAVGKRRSEARQVDNVSSDQTTSYRPYAERLLLGIAAVAQILNSLWFVAESWLMHKPSWL